MNASFLLRVFPAFVCGWAAVLIGAEPPAPPEPPAPVAPVVPPAPAAEASPPPAPDDDRAGLRVIDGTDRASSPDGQRRPVIKNRIRQTDFPLGDHTVPQGTRMREIVSIFGSTIIEGDVVSDAVSIGGRTIVAREAKVGGAAVAVLGRLENRGDIHRDTVSVLGASFIDGRVGGDAVAVLGNMHLGPGAVIEGDLVVVAGRLTKDPAAVVRGEQVHVSIFSGLGEVEWLLTWVRECAFLGRPLAFGAHLGWAWVIAASFLVFHLLVAMLFPRGISAAAETLETRPGGSVLVSVLTVILTPVAFVLLAITIVGALLVPFLALGLLVASLIGKTVMLAWIGRRFTGLMGGGAFGPPVLAVLIGGVIVTGLYTLPVVGFLTFKLLSWLGLGVVVYTVALAMKRDRPPPMATAGAPTPPAGPSVPKAVLAARLAPEPVVSRATGPTGPATMPAGGLGFAAGPAGAAVTPVASPMAPPVVTPSPVPRAEGFAVMMPTLPAPVPPPDAGAAPAAPPPAGPGGSQASTVPDAIAWPRAGFFIRLAALVIDGVLVGLILGFAAGLLPRFLSGLMPRFLQFHDGPGGWLIVLAIYAAVMWKHKGTTIGGIVCGLKVVRVDRRELDWATAIVRAMGCFLSLVVAGLGFVWVAIDDEKQSWHDKIAGTTVVRVPKGVSLV